MAQHSDAVRAAMLNAIEVAGGPSPVLRLRTGPAPANCAAADTGTVVATMNLPADYFADAIAGTKALAGTWQDPAADASGTAAHYRLYTSGGICFQQGTVSGPGGGGEIELQNATLVAGQSVMITSFVMTMGGG